MKKLFTMCVMLCSVIAVVAQSFNVTTAEGYELKYYGNSSTKTAECRGLVDDDAKGGAADLVIPEKVEYNGVDYVVTSIGRYAFDDCEGFSGNLVIGDGVESIGRWAFEGCRGFSGSLTIGDGVTSIGERAFDGCYGFTGSLTIPNGVESIGSSAFDGCSGFSGSLTIPNGVESIGSSAFDGCSGFSGSLTIPASVESIGDYAFSSCSGFTGSLTIPNGVESIGDRAFYGCSGFTGGLTIPDGVTSIGERAFDGCYGFTGSLTIPNGVESIGSSAFDGCSGFSGSLTIPNGVESIGSSAFDGCSGFSGSLTIPASVESIGDYAFSSCSGFTGSLTIPNGVESIGDRAFYGCSGFTGGLTIPDGVTSIGERAFDGCYGFTGSLMIPDGVTSIGMGAFYECEGFTGSLTIGDGVKSIGDRAFEGCKGLTGSLTIPDGVMSIGNSAFYGCSGLTEITSLATVPPSAESSSFRLPNLCVVHVPQGTRAAYLVAEGWKELSATFLEIGNMAELTTIHLSSPNTLWDELDSQSKHPSVVQRMKLSGELGDDDWALIKSNMTALYDLDMTEVTNEAIPYEAFKESKIVYFKFPQGVTTIGNQSFYNANLLGELQLPAGVTSIGFWAFNGCSGLTGSLTIGDGVTSIGGYAFSGCKGFSGSLTIGAGVKSIGEMAFSDCKGFTGSLVIGDGVESIGQGAFYSCSGFTGSLTIPDGVTSIGFRAFAGCSGFTGELMIPDAVTNIERQAFAWCSGFTRKVELPAGLIKINEYLFSCCLELEHIVIPAKVMSIASNAFEECTALDTLTCHAMNPVEMSENFETIDPTTCILQVPTGAKRVYAMAPVWGNFLNIHEKYMPQVQSKVSVRMNEGGDVTHKEKIVANEEDIVVNHDSVLVLNIIPHAGYEMDSITLDSVCVLNNYVDGVLTTPTIHKECNLTITFKKKAVRLLVNEGGVVTHKGDTVQHEQEIEVYTDSTLTLRIVSDSAYHVRSIVLDGEDITALYEDSVLTTPVAESGVLEVTFGKAAVRVMVTDGGVVTYENDTVTSGEEFTLINDSTLTLGIVPNVGYVVKSITLDGEDITSLYKDNALTTPVIDASVELNIVFETMLVRVLMNEGGVVKYEGNVLADSTQIHVLQDSVLTLSIVPDAGYNVKSITLNGEDMMDSYADGVLTTPAIGEDAELKIVFETMLVSVRMNEGGMVRYAGEALTDSAQINVAKGDVLELSIVPNTGKEVQSITLNGEDMMDSYVDGVLTTPAVTEDMILNIEFTVETFDVSLFVEGGTARYATVVDYGTKVAYRISAEENYEIVAVIVNGDDVTSDLDEEGVLTIENITEDKVVLVKTRSTNTDTPQASSEADFTAWGAQRTIYVEATQDMEQVRIIDLEGRMVHSAAVSAYSVMQVQMPQSGVYVVQAEMKDGLLLSQKVIINY